MSCKIDYRKKTYLKIKVPIFAEDLIYCLFEEIILCFVNQRLDLKIS